MSTHIRPVPYQIEIKMSNQRTAYGETLVELGREDVRIVVLEADLSKTTMTYLFQAAFPERFFEMGIAEANMVSFAAGLAHTGKTAFVNSFAVFASGRTYDQIRQGVCIGKLNVKVVGSSSGLSDFVDGATHQSVEDVAIMRAIPNMTVLAPMDSVETRKIVRAAAAYDGPVYIRLNRNDLPELYPENEPYNIGKSYIVREGSDIVVFAHGRMVWEALKTAEIKAEQGISMKVVNVSTLKPFNEADILMHIRGMKGVVTAEEHSVVGGLASAVSYALKGSGMPLEVVAIADRFGQSAHTHDELLAHYGLTAADIAAAVGRIVRT